MAWQRPQRDNKTASMRCLLEGPTPAEMSPCSRYSLCATCEARARSDRKRAQQRGVEAQLRCFINGLAANSKTKYNKSYLKISYLVFNTPEQFLEVTASSVPNDHLPDGAWLVGFVHLLLKRRKSVKSWTNLLGKEQTPRKFWVYFAHHITNWQVFLTIHFNLELKEDKSPF